jgi:hypothetical protein
MHTLPVGGMNTLVGAELKRRVGMTARMGRQTSVRLSESTRAYMLRRARHGNVLARPIDERWQRSYGEFLRSCSHALYWRNPDGRITIPAPTGGTASVFRGDLAPAGAVLEEAVMSLATIPPELKEIRTRPIWPVGVHPTLEITVDDWWPANLWPMTEIRWTVTPGGESGTITASGLVTFPITSRGDVTVELVINILQTNPSFRERPPTVRTERRTVRYRTTDSVQDCVGTLRSDAFDRVLQTSLIFFLEGPQDCGIDSTRLAQHSGKDFGDLFTLGFGAVAEVIADGETIATHRIRWQGARQLFRMSRATAPSIEQQRKLIAAIDAGTARVRITSDPQLALSNLDADRIWVGAIEIPLSSPPPRGPAQRLPARK